MSEPRQIVILGGSGFVGRSVCAQLSKLPGAPTIIVPTRRLSQAHALRTLPRVRCVQADIFQAEALERCLAGADAVVHLVAILHGSPSEFERVHVDLVRQLVQACQRQGVRRVVHVSALGVGPQAPSHYLRTKHQGEEVLHQSGLDVSVLRPSVIFGAQDQFLNLFARMQELLPLIALAGADAKFQPVWVEDVAAAIVQCLLRPRTIGQTFECAGPDVRNLAQLMRLAGAARGCARPIVPLPRAMGRLQAAMLEWAPGTPLMSRDNMDSMKVPNVATGACPGLLDLDIRVSSLESIIPTYLTRR